MITAATVAVLLVGGVVARILLRSDTGETEAPAQVLPGPDCVALVGSEPWLTLFERSQTQSCLIVADFQDVQVWNKGFESLTVAWPGRDRRLAIDHHFGTGPIGDVLESGPNEIESFPFPMPTIWLLPRSLSPSVHLARTNFSLGAARIGMTLDEAAAALGLTIEIHRGLLPGPKCWGAVVPGDPYSPMFVVSGAGDGDSVVTDIVFPGEVLIDESQHELPPC